MEWLSRILGIRGPRSGPVAAQRLQLVLKYDRANLPPGLVEMLKDELLAVVSRYVDVVEGAVEVTLSSAGHRDAPVALVANVPIRGPRIPAARGSRGA